MKKILLWKLESLSDWFYRKVQFQAYILAFLSSMDLGYDFLSSRTLAINKCDDHPKKDPSSLLFLIAFGGDGAPGVGTVFSISFLNVGKRICSSSECFMVFGSDCSEDSPASRAFVKRGITKFGRSKIEGPFHNDFI